MAFYLQQNFKISKKILLDHGFTSSSDRWTCFRCVNIQWQHTAGESSKEVFVWCLSQIVAAWQQEAGKGHGFDGRYFQRCVLICSASNCKNWPWQMPKAKNLHALVQVPPYHVFLPSWVPYDEQPCPALRWTPFLLTIKALPWNHSQGWRMAIPGPDHACGERHSCPCWIQDHKGDNQN